MDRCYDHNENPLYIDQWVTYIDPDTGREEEGYVTACSDNNQVVLYAESGTIRTDGTNVWIHP